MFSKKSQSREVLLPVLDDQFLAAMNGGVDAADLAQSVGQSASNALSSIG